jgi:hypothetical protein
VGHRFQPGTAISGDRAIGHGKQGNSSQPQQRAGAPLFIRPLLHHDQDQPGDYAGKRNELLPDIPLAQQQNPADKRDEHVRTADG